MLLDGMGILTVADTLALERLCDIYADILQLRLTIADEGRTYTVQTDGGFLIKANPAVAMLADADRRFKSYLVEFGLTPAARTKVKVDGGEKKKTRSTSSSVDPATQYARDVDSGKEIAGPDIRNSCKRHLKDLESCHARGLVWDVAAAQRAIDFFAKVLKLNGGEHEGKPFNLLPWQCFIVGSIFGWKNSDDYRRYRMAYVESGKGSGKSPLAAGIALYCLVADKEPRAEVYAAATKKTRP